MVEVKNCLIKKKKTIKNVLKTVFRPKCLNSESIIQTNLIYSFLTWVSLT